MKYFMLFLFLILTGCQNGSFKPRSECPSITLTPDVSYELTETGFCLSNNAGWPQGYGLLADVYGSNASLSASINKISSFEEEAITLSVADKDGTASVLIPKSSYPDFSHQDVTGDMDLFLEYEERLLELSNILLSGEY